MSRKVKEKISTLLLCYPKEQLWRFFIDGHRQYSYLDKDIKEKLSNWDLYYQKKELRYPGYVRNDFYEVSDGYGGYCGRHKPSPACESFDNSHFMMKEPGYMSSCLSTFFNILENVDAALSLSSIQNTHSLATDKIS